MRRIALFAIVIVAGCGGGGDGQATREEFVADLDQICADLDAKVAELGRPETLEEVSEVGPQLLEEFDADIERLRDLGAPPDEIAADVNRFRALAEEQRGLIAEIVEAAQATDTQRIAEVARRGQELEEESDRIAAELGAERCAD